MAKGKLVPCGLCGHGISPAGARKDPTHDLVCVDGKGCLRRRGRKRKK